ncbi:MAG TPA: hypothetical protein VGD37_39740 [Kofleriaceae bacterium]
MIGRIASIVRVAVGSYRVSLEEANGSPIGAFVFEVHDGDVVGATWQDDFEAYIGTSGRPIKPLFEAIFAFHRAQNLDLPPWT